MTDAQTSKRIAELEKQLKASERENTLLQAKLKRADILLDLQKKAAEILNMPLQDPQSDETSL